MVRGDMHDEAIRFARNNAAHTIIVGGDRLGRGAEPRTLIPLVAAYKRNEVEGTRVRFIEVPDGDLHGKFLLWDTDDLIVTSLNWSSADTRRDAPYAEIGVHLTGPGLAKDITARLEHLLQHAPQKHRDNNPRVARRRRRGRHSRPDRKNL
jgi:cardiolipin synthase A/B